MNHMNNTVTSVVTYMSVMNFALSIIENVFVFVNILIDLDSRILVRPHKEVGKLDSLSRN